MMGKMLKTAQNVSWVGDNSMTAVYRARGSIVARVKIQKIYINKLKIEYQNQINYGDFDKKMFGFILVLSE